MAIASASRAPFLILVAGQPAAPLRRHGGFDHWIRVAAGLGRDEAVVIDVEGGDELPTLDAFAGVIVSGSAAMVTERLSWSERAAAWLADASRAGLPLLGICYGHQLLAHALGGTVVDNPAGRRMGTFEVELLPEAADDALLGPLPPRFPAQMTHVQHVSVPPPGAVVLARAEHDPCHAFHVGANTWGVQFHPEFSTTHMRGYLQARAGVLAQEGLDVRALLDAVGAAPQARRVLRRFVHHSRNAAR